MDKIILVVKQIFYISIISTILIDIAPAKKYEKMIRFICGIIMIVIMINPILKLTGNEKGITDLLNGILVQGDMSLLKSNVTSGENQEQNIMISSCEEEVEQNIDSIVINSGMYPSVTKVVIESNKDSPDYGSIKAIYAEVTNKKVNDKSVVIDTIDVTLSGKNGDKSAYSENVSNIASKIIDYYKIDESIITVKYIQ